MLSLKLAYKNLTHAGLRTWLNVFVLSLAFVLIIYTQGLYEGMATQMVRDMTAWEVGGGMLWQQDYDPYDPLTYEDAHSPLREDLKAAVEAGDAMPVLLTQAAIFPDGRVTNVVLKGVKPDQQIVDLPSSTLENFDEEGVIPAVIGGIMSRSNGLDTGDYVTVRWRDINGTFDAAEIKIVHVMNTIVQTVDRAQLWIPIETLRDMMQAPDQATMVVFKPGVPLPDGSPDWLVKTQDDLLEEVYYLVNSKKVGGSVMFAILVAMALLAIFDSQVLAIFRRRKEMGTLMAMGMTRWNVIKLFTMEGSLNGVLAIVVGAIYGIPFLNWAAKTGLSMPEESMEQFGMALASTIYPEFSIKLFVMVTALLFFSVLIVSFLPTRRITRLKPTEALRGRMG